MDRSRGLPEAPADALPAARHQEETLPEALEGLARRAEGYLRSARAPNTIKAYRHDLEAVATWCKVDAGGLSPFPAVPRSVALYITDVAGRGMKAATIQRRLAAIAQLHQEAGLDDPTKTKTVRNTYRGIVREIGSFQEGRAPMLTPTVRRVLRAFEREKGPAAVRDRALLLLGLAGTATPSPGHIWWQDHALEPPFVAVLIQTAVVDPRSAHLHRSSPADDLPFIGVPVAQHQGVSALVALAPGRIEVVLNLCFEGTGEHPPRSGSGDLVEVEQALLAIFSVAV